MTEQKILQYGTANLRYFAISGDPDVLYPAQPLDFYDVFIQQGIVANKAYLWELEDSIDVNRLVVIFATGANPSGRITLSVLPTQTGSAEFEVEFNMTQSIATNAYTADLSLFPPIKAGKWGKLVSTVAASQIVVTGTHCFIGQPKPPSLVV